MKRTFIRTLKAIPWILLGFTLFVAGYYAAAIVLPRIRTDAQPPIPAGDSVTLYVTSNGVHTATW